MTKFCLVSDKVLSVPTVDLTSIKCTYLHILFNSQLLFIVVKFIYSLFLGVNKRILPALFLHFILTRIDFHFIFEFLSEQERKVFFPQRHTFPCSTICRARKGVNKADHSKLAKILHKVTPPHNSGGGVSYQHTYNYCWLTGQGNAVQPKVFFQ